MVGLSEDRQRKQRRQVEHTEQVRLVQRVRAFYPDVIIAAIPNGGARTAQERLRLYGEGVLAGMPDLCVLKPSKGFSGLFVEMKTQDGVVAAAQRDVAKRLNAAGYLCLVARSCEDGWALIKEYLDDWKDDETEDGQ